MLKFQKWVIILGKGRHVFIFALRKGFGYTNIKLENGGYKALKLGILTIEYLKFKTRYS